jgi:subtilase family serine protease
MTTARSFARTGTLVVAALTALAAMAVQAAVAPTPVHSVAVHPFVVGHIAAGSRTTPYTTAICRSVLRISCYDPNQIRQAYDLAPLSAEGLNGSGRTIAIVDSFGSPTIQHDLDVWDANYGLPSTTVQVIRPVNEPYPPFDPTNSDMVGWGVETTLDVEMAHAIAPGAHILLVETPVSETEGVQGFPEIVAAENYVIDHHMADVISQSFGATENTFADFATGAQSLLNLRSAFVNAAAHGVTVLGASGDAGATDFQSNASDLYPFRVNSWPSSDPLVTSIGGTQLHLADTSGARLAPDSVWNDGFGASGGGVSGVFSRPAFQDKVQGVVGSQRGTPDISMSAALDGGAILYYSFVGTGWHVVGGTSEASPLFSGIIAIADQMRGSSLGWINDRLYKLGLHASNRGIVDIVGGNNSFAGVTGYDTTPGYDLTTGWGTIDAASFVPRLARGNGAG